MSSTTDARRPLGQVLVIFGLSLATIIVVAALAFDTGMMLLERRDEQNASDAAALAGARHLPDDPTCLTSPSLANCPKALIAAQELGTANGFTDAEDNEQVDVHVPPATGQFKGLPGFIEVVIRNNRPSIFGGIIGVFGWNVSARAVAANQPGLDLPFAMLTLDPSSCRTLEVTGNGLVTSAGTVQVNSSCQPDGLYVGGTGTLEVTAAGATCNAVGGIQESKGKGSELDCVQVEDSYEITDPLRTKDPPPLTLPGGYPADVVKISGDSSLNIPAGCPGSGAAEATATSPATCAFNGSYAGSVWRLYPGYYPGGLDFGKGTYYLEPGIYYIGGGGFTAGGGGPSVNPPPGTVWSVDAGGTTPGGGILIYNTEAYEFHDECAALTGTAAQCIAAITLNGGTADVNLQPLNDESDWDGMVIFQDRDLNVSAGNPAAKDVQINGGGSTLEVAGTIYVPSGDVFVNGKTGTIIVDQIIAWTFKINGGSGTIDIRYRSGVTAHVSGVGLVE